VDKQTGGFAIDQLTSGDLPEIYLSLVDKAGPSRHWRKSLKSSGLRRWGGKLPGVGLKIRTSSSQTHVQPCVTFRSLEPSTGDLEKIGQADLNAMMSPAKVKWQEVRSSGPCRAHAEATRWPTIRRGAGRCFRRRQRCGSARLKRHVGMGRTVGAWTDRTPAGAMPFGQDSNRKMVYDAGRARSC